MPTWWIKLKVARRCYLFVSFDSFSFYAIYWEVNIIFILILLYGGRINVENKNMNECYIKIYVFTVYQS